jgi:hypothetical protein
MDTIDIDVKDIMVQLDEVVDDEVVDDEVVDDEVVDDEVVDDEVVDDEVVDDEVVDECKYEETMTKISYVFNRVLINFFKEIKKENYFKKAIKKNYKMIDKFSRDYIEKFINQNQYCNIIVCNPEFNMLATYNKGKYDEIDPHTLEELDVFNKDDDEESDNFTDNIFRHMLVSPIFRKIRLGHLFRSFKTDEERNTIYSYFLTLFLLSYIYTEFNDQIEAKGKDEDNDDADPCEQLKMLTQLFNKTMDIMNLVSEGSISIEDFNDKCDDIQDEDISSILRHLYNLKRGGSKTNGGGMGMGENSTLEDILSKSKLGQLAKEISEKVDTDAFNMDNLNMEDLMNPQKLFSALNGSGGEGGDSLIGNIVKQVGGAITDKMSSGQLNQADLMEDALSVVSQLQNGSDSGNPFLNNMMKNMAGMFGGGAGGGAGENNEEDISNMMETMMSQLSGSGSGSGSGGKTGASDRGDTRDRLRRKLENKKKTRSGTKVGEKENK